MNRFRSHRTNHSHGLWRDSISDEPIGNEFIPLLAAGVAGRLSVLPVVLYLPSVMGRPIWDDVGLISGEAFGQNTWLSAMTHPFLGGYFRPLTSVSLGCWIPSYARTSPFYYHQTNILRARAHGGFGRLLERSRITQRKAAGFWAGVFFATQPFQVGAAAWIGGRTDALSAFFLAAFMVGLVQYHRTLINGIRNHSAAAEDLQSGSLPSRGRGWGEGASALPRVHDERSEKPSNAKVHTTPSKAGWLVIASSSPLLLAGLSKEQAIAIFPAAPLSCVCVWEQEVEGRLAVVHPVCVSPRWCTWSWGSETRRGSLASLPGSSICSTWRSGR